MFHKVGWLLCGPVACLWYNSLDGGGQLWGAYPLVHTSARVWTYLWTLTRRARWLHLAESQLLLKPPGPAFWGGPAYGLAWFEYRLTPPPPPKLQKQSDLGRWRIGHVGIGIAV